MPRPLPEIGSLFLSATARDCETPRKDIKRAVEKIPVLITLQEDWTNPAAYVEDVCRDKLTACDGYVGLFGHRYGWTPPGFQESITELEFRWATHHWRACHTPPLFLFIPRTGSEADRALKASAEAVLAEEFPDEAVREASRQKQADFKAAVVTWAGGPGRLINPFNDTIDLVAGLVSTIHHWNQKLIREAPDSPPAAIGRIPDSELGAIGREPQMKALKRARRAVCKQADSLAAAFLVHGPENWGQLQFAQALYAWGQDEEMSVLFGQPLYSHGSAALILQLGALLRVPSLEGPDVGRLAGRVLARLEDAPLLFILPSVGSDPDRLTDFVTGFWRPLVDALATGDRTPPHRLICVVIDHAPLAAPAEALVQTEDTDATDFRCLQALPGLTALTDEDVEAWLEQSCRNLNAPQRRAIAADAADAAGKPPTDVYNRLALNGFWAD